MKTLNIYSKPNCSKCTMLKRWLEIKGIDYNEIDISENQEGMDKLVSSNRISLPVVEIEDEFVDLNEYNDIIELIK